MKLVKYPDLKVFQPIKVEILLESPDEVSKFSQILYAGFRPHARDNGLIYNQSTQAFAEKLYDAFHFTPERNT